MDTTSKAFMESLRTAFDNPTPTPLDSLALRAFLLNHSSDSKACLCSSVIEAILRGLLSGSGIPDTPEGIPTSSGSDDVSTTESSEVSETVSLRDFKEFILAFLRRGSTSSTVRYSAGIFAIRKGFSSGTSGCSASVLDGTSHTASLSVTAFSVDSLNGIGTSDTGVSCASEDSDDSVTTSEATLSTTSDSGMTSTFSTRFFLAITLSKNHRISPTGQDHTHTMIAHNGLRRFTSTKKSTHENTQNPH